MMFLVVFVFEAWFNSALTMYSSKALEGYPAGYLPNCPGVNVTIPISPDNLKILTISIQQDNEFISVKSKYNYYEMQHVASDPGVSFDKPTVMYVGGYMDHPNFPPGLLLAPTYKSLGFNVFLLDTSSFTYAEYPLAARNIRAVGKYVAEMMVNLTAQGLDPQKLSLVGLSLGGQTVSFIAKHYREMTGRNISRITALDPSGPCFRNLGPEDRLDASDADFVDVIKTNIDGFGMAAPIGHVNFYVNGGEYQPGDFIWAPCNVICSHLRALTLWISALYNPNKFIAMQCDSVQQARDNKCYDHTPQVTNVVGLNTDQTKQGVFYLSTYNTYPYFLGEMGLNRKFDFFDSKVNLAKKSKGKKFGWKSIFKL